MERVVWVVWAWVWVMERVVWAVWAWVWVTEQAMEQAMELEVLEAADARPRTSRWKKALAGPLCRRSSRLKGRRQLGVASSCARRTTTDSSRASSKSSSSARRRGLLELRACGYRLYR